MKPDDIKVLPTRRLKLSMTERLVLRMLQAALSPAVNEVAHATDNSRVLVRLMDAISYLESGRVDRAIQSLQDLLTPERG